MKFLTDIKHFYLYSNLDIINLFTHGFIVFRTYDLVEKNVARFLEQNL
jgi:hypothetical protein